jgi:hypothetical protein
MRDLNVKVFYPGITLDQCYALHCSEHYQNKVAEAADTTRHLVSSTLLTHGGKLYADLAAHVRLCAPGGGRSTRRAPGGDGWRAAAELSFYRVD